MKATIGLPELFGGPIFICARPSLRAYRGKLLSGTGETRGTEVYAASFIRKREIVLETQLLSRSADLRLILVHEIFHFVWARLGNGDRQSFRALIEEEIRARVRGELGESAAVHKAGLAGHGWLGSQAKNREYVCESFCDSGSWLFGGVRSSNSWTLGARWRKKRQRWLTALFSKPRGC